MVKSNEQKNIYKNLQRQASENHMDSALTWSAIGAEAAENLSAPVQIR